MQTIGTVNEEGQNVDLYIPRKCHASHRLIPAFDHGAIQIAIGDVDETGQYTQTSRIMCISGFLRSQGESDHAINHLCIKHGIIRGRTGRQPKWLKKRQAEARKKFTTKKRSHGAKRGAAAARGPGGKSGAPRRGPGGKGGAPSGKRAPGGKRPEGKRPDGKRAPGGKRPDGKAGDRPPRPAGKGGDRPPRPAGKPGDRAPRAPGGKGETRRPKPDAKKP